MLRIRSFFARSSFTIVPVFLLLGLVISGCINSLPPPCPQVRVDSNTGTLTKFRDVASQDLSGVEYQVEIVGFEGGCVMDDDEVEVTLDVDFRITGGPAAQAGPVSFYYFVAIPQYFPQSIGKKIFEIQRRLAGGATAPQPLTEPNVRIEIPLKDRQPAASFDVYLGLQLSDEQLEFNRRRMVR
jgi:hypothetical protein